MNLSSSFPFIDLYEPWFHTVLQSHPKRPRKCLFSLEAVASSITYHVAFVFPFSLPHSSFSSILATPESRSTIKHQHTNFASDSFYFLGLRGKFHYFDRMPL